MHKMKNHRYNNNYPSIIIEDHHDHDDRNPIYSERRTAAALHNINNRKVRPIIKWRVMLAMGVAAGISIIKSVLISTMWVGDHRKIEKHIDIVEFNSDKHKMHQSFTQKIIYSGSQHSYFRLAQCDCLQPVVERDYVASCVRRSSSNSGTSMNATTTKTHGGALDMKGKFYPFLPQQQYDMLDDNRTIVMRRIKQLEGLTRKKYKDLLLHAKVEKGYCNSTYYSNATATPPRTVFIESVKPQIIEGIYHQFLAGLLPHISFLLGICDGIVPIDIDPAKITHWVINQGTWRPIGHNLTSYSARVWDAMRPNLRTACGNPNATFEIIRAPRNIDDDGPDPYPPLRLFDFEKDPAYLIVFVSEIFYTLRPSHAQVIRDAVFKTNNEQVKQIDDDYHKLKVVLIDRKEDDYRNIVYNGNRSVNETATMTDGQALLYDTVKLLNSTPVPNGKLYSVSRTIYTNDLGSEGLNQIDMLQDADIVLWTHGQQQSNVIWLPECAITLELLANRQYTNMYDIAR